MPDSIWKSTLEEFRAQLASRDPVPAGVSAAAITASLALSLLIKVLEIARNRRDFRGDPGKVEELLTAARVESSKLAQYADEDTAAFAAYMASRGKPNEPAALLLRKAIEIPLEAARTAAEGLKLCAGAVPMTPASIQPDLGTSTLLLAASVRAMLLSAESNAQRLADPDFQREVAREVENLKLVAQNHHEW
jgi:formiminotetrahydrofolate cyclodeaminase